MIYVCNLLFSACRVKNLLSGGAVELNSGVVRVCEVDKVDRDGPMVGKVFEETVNDLVEIVQVIAAGSNDTRILGGGGGDRPELAHIVVFETDVVVVVRMLGHVGEKGGESVEADRHVFHCFVLLDCNLLRMSSGVVGRIVELRCTLFTILFERLASLLATSSR